MSLKSKKLEKVVMRNNIKEIDFLNYLKEVFSKRCKVNASYSLRAYARSLGIDPSPLSAILKGKRKITPKVKKQLALSLGIKASELHLYTTEGEREANVRGIKLEIIENNLFSILADWYYFPILELFELEDFESSSKWISRKINLNINQVNLALDKLESCGFINRNDNKWSLTGKKFTTHLVPKETSLAKKSYQKQLLELSSRAIDEQPLERRDHTSVVFSIDKDDLEKAREITSNYRKEMMALFNKNHKKTDVYQLQVSLYPLTNPGD